MLNFCGKMVLSATFGLFMAFSAFGLSGCKNEAESEKNLADCGELPALEFSENLKIGKLCGEDYAEIRSIVGRDTLIKRFKLGEPLKRVVALSSAQVGYMLRLGLRDRIVAVGEGKYLVDSVVYARVAAGEVAEVGNGPTLSLEKLMAAKPDLVFDFATGGGMDDYERIGAIGLSLMLTSEWQERTPLAKAEWIKLFGRLFGVESLADSVFEQSKSLYLQATNGGVVGVSPARGGSEQQRASEGEACPRVLVGMSYGGVWHAPGGNSFTARLIKDAGGCYLWAADTNQELQFSLEEILQVADSADVWVNPGMFATPEDLIAAEPRVKFIRAFKEKRVYQNDGIKGAGGGNDFFESAVAYPAETLTNLRSCIQNSTNGADSSQKGFDWYHNIFIF
ncbi:ABC transporter substrate-binding protein [Fibrobacter sp. UWB10]|uniref:ABC transporter substrate-binding protein n=1 Tax=Fibrobacter sp. UWB10 TaxID=1896201 RepID=UPI002403046A|nr:ABC transporter substrate-binding protein [Fibrobacter sp. UWB10]SMP57736.1 iron complex transport system substrate-binding protein [Fibrobacter sp. UWB10]